MEDETMNLIQYLQTATYPHTGTPIIAFLGDSVTHGAFECIQGDSAGCIFDMDAVYHERLRRMLLTVNPWLPVSIINAGVAGDNAIMGLARLERDVISHKPHICVVNFCLNDLSETVEEYVAALREIFTRLMAADIRPILLTPSMLNTYVHPDTIPMYRDFAAVTAGWHQSGVMDGYVEAAKTLAAELGVAVADAYAKWKALEAEGMDVTENLANYINHPSRELHQLFADALFETLQGEV
jgi:lysophospholipase L1-like esterase